MNTRFRVLALTTTSLIFAATSHGASKEVVWPADAVVFKQVIPGISKAALWGDPSKGAYATLTRFTRGTRADWHTHSHDIRVVVISGTFIYDSGSGERRLGPGSYLLRPAGVKHVSGAGAEADCVFLEESDGAFDHAAAK